MSKTTPDVNKLVNPFDIIVYNKYLGFEGFVVDPIFVNVVPSWDDQGYANFSVAANNPHIAALQDDGARITIDYLGQHIVSGPIRSWIGDIAPRGYVTFQMLDDKRILSNTLLYVDPDKVLKPASLSDRGQAWYLDGDTQTVGSKARQYGYFHWPDGSSFDTVPAITIAETAIKHVIQRNCIDRLGLPITIKPDQKRGGNVVDVLPKVRFVPLSEVMTPITKKSRLGVTVGQARLSKTIDVDVKVPSVWGQTLTLEGGTIVEGSYAHNAPTLTRAMLAGPGETAGRALSGFTGKGRTAVETQYGDVIEVFKEVDGFGDLVWPKAADGKTELADEFKAPKYYPFRGTAAQVAAFNASFDRAEATALEEGGPLNGITLKLQENETFHFGGTDGVQLGDVVNVEIQGVPYSDTVTSCQMDFTRDNGTVIRPLVGNRADDPDKALARKVASLYKAYRRTAAMR